MRGFEVVKDEHRRNYLESPTRQWDNKKVLEDGKVIYVPNITLPVRSTVKSAGYDFFSPITKQILPGQQIVFFSDVKAYMPDNEVLLIFIRSSLAIKHGLTLSNNVGVIDADYYSNASNDGNIGMFIKNNSGRAVEIKEGDKIAQGIFVKYGVVENDSTSEERTGGMGSTGR